MKIVKGGVCAPKGFLSSGIHAGIRKNPEKKDLALIYSSTPCKSAGITTQNKVVAAPVLVTREHLLSGNAQAIICNSGNANACTHNQMEIANEMCKLTGESLNIPKEKVLVASTGVIGQAMDITPVKEGLPLLVEELSGCSKNAGQAIMTTDLTEKNFAVSFQLNEKIVTIGGIAKGSGMIHPNMATMLAFITTDAEISQEMLQESVKEIGDKTFNMISVDGDTSTNDMLLVLANGLAGNKPITLKDDSYKKFSVALEKVLTHLAIAIAADGEGASKLLTCNVTGGKSLSDARIIAKSVVKSNLLKAAMFGEDSNWGRVLCAIGYSGADFSPDKCSVEFQSSYGSICVCENGLQVDFDEELSAKILTDSEIVINIMLKDGVGNATAWGCDLTYNYVKINGAYRS